MKPLSQRRDLLIIDDSSIRKQAASEAWKILRKLEKLERKKQIFFDRDRTLFEKWYEKQFVDDEKHLHELQKTFDRLAQINNWTLALAEMENLSLSEALAIIEEEEIRWQEGDEEDRKEIERDRRDRNEFILAKLYPRFQQGDFVSFEEFLSSIFSVSPPQFVKIPPESEVEGKSKTELKSLFRKTAKLLHPDVNEKSKKKINRLDLWGKAQEAYKNLKLDELKKIYLMALLSKGELSSLTLDEIKGAAHWLYRELEDVTHSLEGIKNHPAWGFSKKRKMGTMVSRLKIKLNKMRRQLEDEVAELQLRQELMKRWS